MEGKIEQPTDPFSQLDSQLSQGQQMEQKAVETQPGQPDAWGALDQQLQNKVADVSTGDSSNKPASPYENGAAWAGIDSYIRTNQNMVDSVLDLGARIGEVFGGGPELAAYRKELQKSNETMNKYVDEEAKLHPYASATGTGVGIVQQVIQGLATTGGSSLTGSGASLLRKAGIGAGEGMVYGGLLNYSPTIEGRVKNATIGGLLGAAAPIAVKGYSEAGENIANTVINKATGLSNTLGRVLPGNAGNAAANDVNVVNNAKNQVQTILDDFVPGGKKAVEAQQAELYKGLENVNLNEPATASLMSNPVIKSFADDLSQITASTKKALPDSNFAKLDQIKQNIDQALYKDSYTINTANTTRALDSETRSAYQQALDQIKDTLNQAGDEVGVDYAGLRKMGELKSLYTKLSDTLKQASNQRNLDPTFDTNNVVQNKSIGKLYDVLAGTDLKKEYLINAVESAGGNVDNVKGVISLLNKLRNNPVEKAIAGSGKSAIIDSNASKNGLTASFVNYLLNGRYNNQVLKLITSGPKMQENLSKALEAGTISKSLTALKPLISRVSDNAGKIAGSRANGAVLQDSDQGKGYLSN